MEFFLTSVISIIRNPRDQKLNKTLQGIPSSWDKIFQVALSQGHQCLIIFWRIDIFLLENSMMCNYVYCGVSETLCRVDSGTNIVQCVKRYNQKFELPMSGDHVLVM